MLVVCGGSGGAITGTVLAAVGWITGTTGTASPYIAVTGLAVLGVLEVSPRVSPVSVRKWQVPISWLNRGAFVDAATWGLTLGSGLLTYSGTNVVMGLWVVVLLSLDVKSGALVGLIYGTTRMGMIAVASAAWRRRRCGQAGGEGGVWPGRVVRHRIVSLVGIIALAVAVITGFG